MPKVREDEIFARLFEPSEEEKMQKIYEDILNKIIPTWRVFDDVELYIVEDEHVQNTGS